MRTIQKCFLFLSFFASISCEIVRINNGLLEGTTMTTRRGESFYAFLKIPFAEPPVPNSPLGNLRFQPPVKKAPWTGVWNATEYGPMCMQLITRGETWPMDEDCLHLNVFTKNLGNSTLKPVIVFIHGGSYEVGAAYNHGPLYLMERNVVLVTVNYRMGAFGFLAAGTNKAIGNMGLKDNVMALEWIQENIAHFGGDPNQVTISGLSAGGFSVSMLILSEMSRHLFKRAILMSGAITSMSKFESDYELVAKELGRAVNCTGSDYVECLQEIPKEILVAADISGALSCPISFSWAPVIEKDFNQTKFLSRSPFEILKDDPENNFKDIQIMIGITSDEMIYAAPSLVKSSTLTSMIKNNFNQMIYNCFRTTTEVPKDTSKLKNLYFPLNEIDQRSTEGMGELISDGFIGYGSHRFVHLLSNFTDVYYYKFNYAGQQSVFNHPREYPYGITHGDDIQYVLNTWYVAKAINVTHQDNFMIEKMTRIWEQFAYRGNPNNSTDEYLRTMVWPKHDWVNEYYLEIGTHMVEKHGLYLSRFIAWDELNSAASKHQNVILISIISLLLKLFM